MPRPRLRPEPAGLELIDPQQPPDWDQAFGFPGPLELEIGSGAGGFALEYARRFPNIRLVALEWRKKYARFSDQRAKERGLRNLKVVEGDAREVVPMMFRPGTLSAIHLQFPDPWWKRSHAKRAMITPPLARLFLDLLAPGGLFDLRTDVEDRARAMLECLEQTGFINPLGPGAFHPYDPEEVPSTRERRYLISQQPVYRARLRKG